MPRVTFFWGNRWTLRGLTFDRKTHFRNIHYIDLVFCRGSNRQNKIKNGIGAWKGLLTLGRSW